MPRAGGGVYSGIRSRVSKQLELTRIIQTLLREGQILTHTECLVTFGGLLLSTVSGGGDNDRRVIRAVVPGFVERSQSFPS
jgi:hypothetical protein